MDGTEPTKLESSSELPVAAIICIAIGAYIVVVVILLIIRSVLLQRGICKDCACCGKEGEPFCCECWISCCESLNCCGYRSAQECLDNCCCPRKKHDCADIITCQCCADPDTQCCGKDPICDLGCGVCNCQCQPPECDNVNCLCCTFQSQQQQFDEED